MSGDCGGETELSLGQPGDNGSKEGEGGKRMGGAIVASCRMGHDCYLLIAVRRCT